MLDYARTGEQKQMLDLIFGSVAMSRPFAAPPGLPPDRLEGLRDACAKAATDPDTIADAAGNGFEVRYVPPRAIENLLARAYGASAALVQKSAVGLFREAAMTLFGTAGRLLPAGGQG